MKCVSSRSKSTSSSLAWLEAVTRLLVTFETTPSGQLTMRSSLGPLEEDSMLTTILHLQPRMRKDNVEQTLKVISDFMCQSVGARQVARNLYDFGPDLKTVDWGRQEMERFLRHYALHKWTTYEPHLQQAAPAFESLEVARLTKSEQIELLTLFIGWLRHHFSENRVHNASFLGICFAALHNHDISALDSGSVPEALLTPIAEVRRWHSIAHPLRSTFVLRQLRKWADKHPEPTQIGAEPIDIAMGSPSPTSSLSSRESSQAHPSYAITHPRTAVIDAYTPALKLPMTTMSTARTISGSAKQAITALRASSRTVREILEGIRTARQEATHTRSANPMILPESTCMPHTEIMALPAARGRDEGTECWKADSTAVALDLTTSQRFARNEAPLLSGGMTSTSSASTEDGEGGRDSRTESSSPPSADVRRARSLTRRDGAGRVHGEMTYGTRSSREDMPRWQSVPRMKRSLRTRPSGKLLSMALLQRKIHADAELERTALGENGEGPVGDGESDMETETDSVESDSMLSEETSFTDTSGVPSPGEGSDDSTGDYIKRAIEAAAKMLETQNCAFLCNAILEESDESRQSAGSSLVSSHQAAFSEGDHQ